VTWAVVSTSAASNRLTRRTNFVGGPRPTEAVAAVGVDVVAVAGAGVVGGAGQGRLHLTDVGGLHFRADFDPRPSLQSMCGSLLPGRSGCGGDTLE
jgi:hypothetical protein